jgi:N-ethylmaleimide reductase
LPIRVARFTTPVMTDRLLFSPLQLGDYTLKNRIVMAPMTRCRAIGNVPNALMAQYYGQRASAGLLITEGTAPSANALGYARIPGCFTAEQIAGWQLVTRSVHAAGGRIFVQIMHTGRVGALLNMPAGTAILAPSAIPMTGKIWTDQQGEQPYGAPQAMATGDVEQAVREFTSSAEAAIEAGFDGVELHGANGYLIDQFLNPASNQRTDAYGGTPENRRRFALEIARGVVRAIGAGRVGFRISPCGTFNDMTGEYDGMSDHFVALTEQLSALGIAYLHLVGNPAISESLRAALRKGFRQRFLLNGGYTSETAERDLGADRGDAVAFGRPFIANPDLPEKLRTGASLTAADMSTFYTPGEKGYVDYAI